jgi:hypothetical protein
MSHNRKSALLLAERFHKTHVRLGPGPEFGGLSHPFDLETLPTELLVRVFEELIDTGVLMPLPQPPGGMVRLVAIQDGRRSRRDTPDELMGWQFRGQIDDSGKPTLAPRWAMEAIKFDFKHNRTMIKTTDSSMMLELHIGEWVVYNNKHPHQARPRLYVLTPEKVARWYKQDHLPLPMN